MVAVQNYGLVFLEVCLRLWTFLGAMVNTLAQLKGRSRKRQDTVKRLWRHRLGKWWYFSKVFTMMHYGEDRVFLENIYIYFFQIFIYLFIYLWLGWAFVSVWGLSPVAASGGHSSSRCAGLSPPRPLPLQSTGSRRAGSAIVAHGPRRSVACGIFPDQGSNPCPLHWQADSQLLRHQGSPLENTFSFYGNST